MISEGSRRRNRTRNSARALSKRGFIVHELCGPTHGCGSPGKVPHQRGWNEGGVKDRDWISGAFRSGARSSNIGVRCVPELLILDCDVHAEGADGFRELSELYAANDRDAPTPTMVSGSGGVHVWLRVPNDVVLACNRKLLPNVDTRTGGVDKSGKLAKVGQVAVPPSLHTSGREYTWHDRQLPDGLDTLRMAPRFILEMLKWEPPPVEVRASEPTLFNDVGADGFDVMTREYWAKALHSLASMPSGGGGVRSRNTSLFSLGALARSLDNAVPARQTPGKARMMADAIAAARAAGLEDDLERQFENGWGAGARDMNSPPVYK